MPTRCAVSRIKIKSCLAFERLFVLRQASRDQDATTVHFVYKALRTVSTETPSGTAKLKQRKLNLLSEQGMASIFDDKAGKTVIKGCWNQETKSRSSYVRSQSENQGNKAMDSLELPNMSAQETSSIARNVSAPSFRPVDLPKIQKQRSSKLHKTMSQSDSELREAVTLVAINNEGNSMLTNKPRLEHKGFSNETSLKERKVFRRRASLPASHLGQYLSVNNIRKRAQNSGANDSDRNVVLMNKVKNANRKKLRVPSSEEPILNTDTVEERDVVSNEVENSVGFDLNADTRPKIAVRGFVASLSSSLRMIVHD